MTFGNPTAISGVELVRPEGRKLRVKSYKPEAACLLAFLAR
jgi:hypothetical protein